MVRLIVWIVLMMSVVACGASQGGDAPAPPAAKADIRGQITNVTASAGDAGTLGSIMIEGAIEADTNFDKASIRITPDTQIVRLIGGERQPATLADLQVGTPAQATFTGPVAESYPVQAVASEIVLLD